MQQKGYLRTNSTPLKPGDIGGNPQKFVYGPEILTPWMDEPEKHRSLLKVLDFWRQAYRGTNVQWCLNVCKLGGYTAPQIIALINAAAATVITDHGGLGGLGDDDHTQYALTDGTRTITGAPRYSIGDGSITGDVDDYVITTGIYSIQSDASRKITGIVAIPGVIIKIENTGSNDVVLANEDTGSDAANRIITGLGMDYTLAPGTGVWLAYDSGPALRWRINS